MNGHNDYNFLTLSNGLRIIHRHDPSTAMVAMAVLYDTGARDEKPTHTGLAHLMEHLMFSGSVNVPDFDGAVQRAGGMNNAWTSNDFTCFYDVVPAQNVETLFWIESDRMMQLAFSEQSLEVQKKVVVQEFYQQCLNRPYGQLHHALRSLAYREHPYRWPVIGLEPGHIEQTRLDDIRDYYNAHYSPANAVVAVVGNVTFDKVERHARQWFETIEPRPVSPRRLPVEPIVEEKRETTVVDKVPNTLLSINFPMDAYGTDAYFLADFISDILSSGRSSILYRNLMLGESMFDSVDASIQGSEHPGLFNITAVLREGTELNDARRAIRRQLDQFASGNVSEEDRQRALNRIRTANVFSDLEPLGRAQNLAIAFYHGHYPDQLLERYRAFSPEEIRRQAETLFNPDREITVIYRPEHQ